MINVTLDGEKKTVSSTDRSLCTFIKSQGFERSIIIVRLNGDIVLYEEHKKRLLNDGDMIEVEHVLLAGG